MFCQSFCTVSFGFEQDFSQENCTAGFGLACHGVCVWWGHVSETDLKKICCNQE